MDRMSAAIISFVRFAVFHIFSALCFHVFSLFAFAKTVFSALSKRIFTSLIAPTQTILWPRELSARSKESDSNYVICAIRENVGENDEVVRRFRQKRKPSLIECGI